MTTPDSSALLHPDRRSWRRALGITLVVIGGFASSGLGCGGGTSGTGTGGESATSSQSSGTNSTSSQGSGGATATSTGSTGSTGTGGMGQCTDPTQCPGVDDDCQKRTCVEMKCGVAFTAAGTPTVTQTAGDCQSQVCDGSGKTQASNDDTDVPNDANDCTLDACAAGVASSTPVAAAAPCATGGGLFCDGNGACVECLAPSDCTRGVCQANKCVAPTCVDTVKNGAETDVDCGGATCNKCATNLVCAVAGDCASGVCTGLKCAAPVCNDSVKNGSETDVDCGGPCAPCARTLGCSVATDCLSKVCTAGVCQVPVCTDMVKNGVETDVDCGGMCSPCAVGKVCAVSGDCASTLCIGNVCIASFCGDGFIVGGEQCDDGNMADGDGCSSTCALEMGFTCAGSPTVCTAVCGDGVKKPSEACDDGNLTNGDGCSATCTVQAGYQCTGSPSLCTTVCGDGVKAGAEQCDDSNVVNGDGCSATCQFETTQIVTAGPGLAAAIVDNAYAGTLATMTCVNIVVPSFPLNNVASTTIQINMSHTWVGDLTFKLVSALGTTVTLMSRPGFAEVADDGTGASSESANLVLGFPITFQNGAAVSAETMGNGSASTAWRVCQDDGICTFAPNNGAAPAGNLTTFNGQAANGTWKFCVGDGGAGDVGIIDKVVLTLGKQ